MYFNHLVFQTLCHCAKLYADLIHTKLMDKGYYDEDGQFDVTEEVNEHSFNLFHFLCNVLLGVIYFGCNRGTHFSNVHMVTLMNLSLSVALIF
jgi:hypothetical protein